MSLLAQALPELIDQEAAAQLLRASRSTLYRLRRSGQLAPAGHGRYGRTVYRRTDVERLARDGWLIPELGWDGLNVPDPLGRLTQDPRPA